MTEPLFKKRDYDTIEENIADMNWKNASTYADAPHSYTLRRWEPDVFAHYEKLLKEQGVYEEFTLRGRTCRYRYLYPGDGYRYWIIKGVLNRCPADQRRTDRPGEPGAVGAAGSGGGEQL